MKKTSKYHVLDASELQEILFHDFQLIKKMKAPIYNRSKMLSTLFSINSNSWRVIGITPAALEVFKANDYKKVSGMGINRSHIVQRSEIYHQLLNSDFSSAQDFWQKYYENDMTILATSTENMSKAKDALKVYYPVPSDERDLFKTSGFAWKHKDEEEEFLKALYKLHIKTKNNGKV
jgi:hypothetical protein